MVPLFPGEVRVAEGEPEDFVLGPQPAQQLSGVRAGGEFISNDEEQEPALDRARPRVELRLDPAGACVQGCGRSTPAGSVPGRLPPWPAWCRVP